MNEDFFYISFWSCIIISQLNAIALAILLHSILSPCFLSDNIVAIFLGLSSLCWAGLSLIIWVNYEF